MAPLHDDLPLWSAPFGLALLDALRLRADLRVLDVGCGTGFPALEIAARLGPSSHVVAVDPCAEALAVARAKRARDGLGHVDFVEAGAESLPFEDATFDAVVSNNGLNNVADPARAIEECRRVTRDGGQLIATMNLPDTMHELYEPFADILRMQEGASALDRLRAHVAIRRPSVAQTTAMLGHAGFALDRVVESEFVLRFADADALFSHPLVRLAFYDAWLAVPRPENATRALEELRGRLNASASDRGELRLTIPFACYDSHAAASSSSSTSGLPRGRPAAG